MFPTLLPLFTKYPRLAPYSCIAVFILGTLLWVTVFESNLPRYSDIQSIETKTCNEECEQMKQLALLESLKGEPTATKEEIIATLESLMSVENTLTEEEVLATLEKLR